ncbi:hypothetical protein ACIRJM_45205 [Streptomyces sp. NPDC102405]|uniref:hypothetical protein n=1 Tax=Streptomyces sp. NPDC102405 TaxID=3366170 RepID=UPI00382BB4DE
MKPEQIAFRFVVIALETEPAHATVLTVKEIMRRAGIDKTCESYIVQTLVSWEWAVEKPGFFSSRLLWTDTGRAYAQNLKQAAGQKVSRDAHLHHALLAWAYEHTPANGTASIEHFEDADDWWFWGTPVTWEEVSAAVHYLEAAGLLTVNYGEKVYVRPTFMGTRFIHSKEDLGTFLARQIQPSSGVAHHYSGSIVVHGNPSGSALVTGDNNAINLGVRAAALSSFGAQLRQVAPFLGLSQDDAEDLAAEINTLERGGIDPDSGHRSWRSIRRILLLAFATTATADSKQAIRATITAGSDLFG